MFNIVRQEPQTQEERLARISRHFLSEPQAASPPQSQLPVRLLPLLCASEHGARYTCRLVEALQQAGHSTELLACNAVVWDAASLSAATDQTGLPRGQRLHFVLPVLDRSVTAVPAASSIALLVSAQLAGLREAYQLIQHYNRTSTRRIGIILMDSPDRRSAWIHFQKLAMESRRFLHVPLVNLGFLATDPDQASPMVADRIVHNRFFLPYVSRDSDITD